MRRSASAPLLTSDLPLSHTVETLEASEGSAISKMPTVHLPSGLSLSLITEISQSNNINETIRGYVPKVSENEHLVFIEQTALCARFIHNVTGRVKSRLQDLRFSPQTRQEVQHYHPPQPPERPTGSPQLNVQKQASQRTPPQAPAIKVPPTYISKVIMEIEHNAPATPGELLILLASFFPKATKIELQELLVSIEECNECLYLCSGATADKLLRDHVFLPQTHHHTPRPAGMSRSTPEQEQPLLTSPIPDESMPGTSFTPETSLEQPDAAIDSDALPEHPTARPKFIRCNDGLQRRAKGAFVYVAESQVHGNGAFARSDIPKGKVYAEHNGFFVYKIHLKRRVKQYVVCNTLDKDETLKLHADDRFVAWLDLYYLVDKKTKVEIGINGTRAISFINHIDDKERINTKLVVRYPIATNGKPIKTIKSRSDFENYLHNIYINVQATKDIKENTELLCNYRKEGDTKSDPFKRNVLPPSQENLKKVKNIIARSYRNYNPPEQNPDEPEDLTLDYETDKDNLSDMELEESSSSEPKKNTSKETEINLQEKSELLANFHYKILSKLHNDFEERENCRLNQVIKKIDKSDSTDQKSYHKILKLIAKWIIMIACPDSDINKNKVIEDMADLTNTSPENAEILLHTESQFIQSRAFYITLEEWKYYHKTGNAWSLKVRQKRTCTIETKKPEAKRQHREASLHSTQSEPPVEQMVL